MAIFFDEERSIFHIMTEHTSYYIGIVDKTYIGHVYYGRRMEDCGCGYLMRTRIYMRKKDFWIHFLLNIRHGEQEILEMTVLEFEQREDIAAVS